MKKEINLIAAIVIMVVIGGGAFYGGTVYQKSQASKTRGNFISRTGQPGQGAFGARQFGQANGARPVSGQIISLDDKSATVKLADGSSKIVIFADSTIFNKSESGSKSDLAQGDKVMAIGTQNSDGSLTAQNVQINPAGQK